MSYRLRHGLQMPGARDAEIEACEAALKVRLPEEYKAFLRDSNGFNDKVGAGYFILWSVAELARADGQWCRLEPSLADVF
jgi:hypothetical protein